MSMLLNEVLSITAQECDDHGRQSANHALLNEVLSITAQESLVSEYRPRTGPSSMKS